MLPLLGVPSLDASVLSIACRPEDVPPVDSVPDADTGDDDSSVDDSFSSTYTNAKPVTNPCTIAGYPSLTRDTAEHSPHAIYWFSLSSDPRMREKNFSPPWTKDKWRKKERQRTKRKLPGITPNSSNAPNTPR